MHPIGGSSILTSAHQVVVASCASFILCAFNSFFVDDSHLVEIILSEVKVLSSFSLHLFSGIIVYW